ncbi:MAG TPA: YqhA family protein [Roseiflexaceae bacterium]|nr:YqhA family protein [Roseiflexaceae bacterium]
MPGRVLASSRYMIIIAVLCSLIAAATLLIYGAFETYHIIAGLIGGGKIEEKIGKQLILDFIELVDLFLLGTVLFIVGVGLYELFIDSTVPLPGWLVIRTLDDLKNKLIAVVIVVLGVVFLGQVVSWDGQRDLLGIGAAIALVIAALTFFLSQTGKKKSAGDSEEQSYGK